MVGNPGVADVGQRYRPSYTRVRAPGCYAYKIDGTTFSARCLPRPARHGDDARSSGRRAKLRRPLHLPVVAPGTRCPVSAVDETFAFDRYGVRQESVPAPPGRSASLAARVSAEVRISTATDAEWAGSEWSGQKVLWFVSPHVTGPILSAWSPRRPGTPPLQRREGAARRAAS